MESEDLPKAEAAEIEAGRTPPGPTLPSRWWRVPAIFGGALLLGILVGLLAVLAQLVAMRLIR